MGSILSYKHGEDSVGGVDPRLWEIVQAAVAASPYDAVIRSGSEQRAKNGTNHNKGWAVDVTLVDPSTGQKLPDYQDGAAFSAYEQYAQAARVYQQDRYPELENVFRWGGYFSKDGKATGYGAADLMHLDINPNAKGAMALGSWSKGAKQALLDAYPGAVSNGGLGGANGTRLVSQYKQSLAGSDGLIPPSDIGAPVPANLTRGLDQRRMAYAAEVGSVPLPRRRPSPASVAAANVGASGVGVVAGDEAGDVLTVLKSRAERARATLAAMPQERRDVLSDLRERLKVVKPDSPLLLGDAASGVQAGVTPQLGDTQSRAPLPPGTDSAVYDPVRGAFVTVDQRTAENMPAEYGNPLGPKPRVLGPGSLLDPNTMSPGTVTETGRMTAAPTAEQIAAIRAVGPDAFQQPIERAPVPMPRDARPAGPAVTAPMPMPLTDAVQAAREAFAASTPPVPKPMTDAVQQARERYAADNAGPASNPGTAEPETVRINGKTVAYPPGGLTKIGDTVYKITANPDGTGTIQPMSEINAKNGLAGIEFLGEKSIAGDVADATVGGMFAGAGGQVATVAPEVAADLGNKAAELAGNLGNGIGALFGNLFGGAPATVAPVAASSFPARPGVIPSNGSSFVSEDHPRSNRVATSAPVSFISEDHPKSNRVVAAVPQVRVFEQPVVAPEVFVSEDHPKSNRPDVGAIRTGAGTAGRVAMPAGVRPSSVPAIVAPPLSAPGAGLTAEQRNAMTSLSGLNPMLMAGAGAAGKGAVPAVAAPVVAPVVAPVEKPRTATPSAPKVPAVAAPKLYQSGDFVYSKQSDGSYKREGSVADYNAGRVSGAKSSSSSGSSSSSSSGSSSASGLRPGDRTYNADTNEWVVK